MAISVTTDLTTITAAESTTDSGTHYRLNGTSTGNPAADADAFVQGSNCIANKMGATVGTTDVGGHFNATATFDITGKHLFHWRQIVTAGNQQSKASGGTQIGLTNTSTTSTSAWSTTNHKKWYLDGGDTVPSADGWKCYVLDPASTPNASAGTLTLSAIKNIGFLCRQTSSVTTTVSNQFYDAVRIGNGLTATTTSGTDVITMSSIYAVDSNKTNMWGVVTQSAGVYYGSGKITIGASGQTAACNFTDADQVFIWRNFPVASNLYEFNLVGNATYTTTLQLTGWVVRGQAGKGWTITCGTGSAFKGYGCALANLSSATLSATSVLDGCSIDASGTLDVNGATVVRCSFGSPSATQLKVDSPTEMSAISDSDFNSSGTGHAIELTTAGDYALDALSFTGYASSNGSTGNETVYVSASSGTVTINTEVSISVRTAGATVNVVTGQKTKTFTGLPSGTEVRIRQGSYTLATDGNVTNGSYAYSYSPNNKPAKAQFTLPGYAFEDIALTLDATDQTFPVTWAPDPSYTAT